MPQSVTRNNPLFDKVEAGGFRVSGSFAPSEYAVMRQLFANGPTWDGNILCKTTRDHLIGLGLAARRGGWTYLTDAGMEDALGLGIDRDKKRRDRGRRYAGAEDGLAVLPTRAHDGDAIGVTGVGDAGYEPLCLPMDKSEAPAGPRLVLGEPGGGAAPAGKPEAPLDLGPQELALKIEVTRDTAEYFAHMSKILDELAQEGRGAAGEAGAPALNLVTVDRGKGVRTP